MRGSLMPLDKLKGKPIRSNMARARAWSHARIRHNYGKLAYQVNSFFSQQIKRM